MMNVGNPEEVFALSFIPNDGVGLAREEFIISNYIKIHPLALLDYAKIEDAEVKAKIDRLTVGYDDKPQFFVDKLAQGVAMIAAAFYPKDVIVRLSDFKTNEYANLIGGRAYEPIEENPMLGFRGASRYYDPRYQAGFALECRAMKKVRDEMGLTNLKLMVPFCRTVEEGRKVIAEMAKHGLKRGENGLEVYVMCEIPSNVILAEEFAEIFDGFSIGSNDLTQLILGVDRDSEIVAQIFDERNPAVKKMIAEVIAVCRRKGRKIGICGQAPSDYPEFAQFLVEQGIDSISLNPDTVLKTTVAILEKERNQVNYRRRNEMNKPAKLVTIVAAIVGLVAPSVGRATKLRSEDRGNGAGESGVGGKNQPAGAARARRSPHVADGEGNHRGAPGAGRIRGKAGHEDRGQRYDYRDRFPGHDGAANRRSSPRRSRKETKS